MREPKIYFVYIMSNRSKTLYTGITGNLIGRVRRHKLAMASQFTSKYKLDRLVYFERYEDVHKAIEREKEIKLAADQEDCVDCVGQSGLAGFESGMV